MVTGSSVGLVVAVYVTGNIARGKDREAEDGGSGQGSRRRARDEHGHTGANRVLEAQCLRDAAARLADDIESNRRERGLVVRRIGLSS